MPNSLSYFLGINVGRLVAAIFGALFILAAVAGGIVLSATVFSKKNDGRYKGFMGKLYDLVNFKKFAVVPLLRATYITLVIYVTFEAIMCFPTYGFWTGLGRFALTLVVGNAALRIIYEIIMLLVKGVRSLKAIQRGLNAEDNDDPEFMESLITPKNRVPAPAPMAEPVPMSAPAPAPAPMPATTSMAEPVPMSAPAPAPAPMSTPTSMAEPVPMSAPASASAPMTAPIPKPAPMTAPTQDSLPGSGYVSQSVQSDENGMMMCANCGREIKVQSRFCPYCGTKRNI